MQDPLPMENVQGHISMSQTPRTKASDFWEVRKTMVCIQKEQSKNVGRRVRGTHESIRFLVGKLPSTFSWLSFMNYKNMLDKVIVCGYLKMPKVCSDFSDKSNIIETVTAKMETSWCFADAIIWKIKDIAKLCTISVYLQCSWMELFRRRLEMATQSQ